MIECSLFICSLSPWVVSLLWLIYGEGQMLNSYWCPHCHSAAPQTISDGKGRSGQLYQRQSSLHSTSWKPTWSKKSQSSVKLSWLTGLCWELYVLHRAETGCSRLCRSLSDCSLLFVYATEVIWLFQSYIFYCLHYCSTCFFEANYLLVDNLETGFGIE